MVRKASKIMPPDTDAELLKDLKEHLGEAKKQLDEHQKDRRQLDKTYERQCKALDKMLAADQRNIERLTKQINKLGG